MAIQPVEIKPFKSIRYGLSLLQKYHLLNVTFDTNKPFPSDTEYDTLLNWLILSKFLKTVYLRHNQMTLYNISVKTVGEIEDGITFSIKSSLNDIKICSNIIWDWGDGKRLKLEETELSESLRGLSNWSKDCFWKIIVQRFWAHTMGDGWHKVYFQIRRIAEEDTFAPYG